MCSARRGCKSIRISNVPDLTQSPTKFGKFPESESLTAQMRNKIDTVEGRRIYSQRLANVEPVFGNIRAQKGLDRFTLRGKAKVNIQWKFFCIVHNMEKIGGYGATFSRN